MKRLINNIPNLITISRIISCLFGATLFTLGNIPVAIGCYVYGAVSDAFDGYFARKLNAITDLGKKLDSISDKLYALSLMVPSIISGNCLMIVPLVLEGIISGINVYADIKYKKTYTEKVGKIKTILLFPTMILGLLVTKIPNIYIAFLPLMVLSSKYQAKSILAYSKQLEKIKESNIELKQNITKEKNNINIKEEDKTISDNLDDKNVKKNTVCRNKKLIRKKDYNDRY